jgi:hypothetical protein
MGWIRKHRPSPGTAFGFVALTVALGGVAFAAIPDSNGTIHACYQRNGGNLRVVQSDSDCRASESPLSWSQQGPPGNAVVARVRSTRSVNLSGGSNGNPATFDEPLSSNTWTQPAGELEEVFGQIDTTTTCGAAAVAVLPFVTISIDGHVVRDVIARPGLTDFEFTLFEKDESVTHTMTATASARGCAGDPTPTIESVKVDVVGFR